jgi:peptide deformylase
VSRRAGVVYHNPAQTLADPLDRAKTCWRAPFLHETDHLYGKLYISHISALKRDLIRRKVRKLVKAGEWE